MCCLGGGGLGARLGLGSEGIQRCASTSVVLGPESSDEGWGQDRAVVQHLSEVRGLPLLQCRAAL